MYPASIAAAAAQAWSTAESHGFHDGTTSGRKDTLLRLCLIHTEVSEAAQIVKKRYPPDDARPDPKTLKDLAAELADVIIRVFDLAECCGIDIQNAVNTKEHFNATRPFLYGTAQEARNAT